MGIWIFHHLMGGGGGGLRPPASNSTPIRRSEKPKNTFGISGEIITEVIQSVFRGRSILRSLEVIKGQIYRNFVFLRKCAIISETIEDRRPGKKAFDSSSDVLSLICLLILDNINGFRR